MRGAKGLEGPLRSLEHGKLTIGPIPGPDPVTVPHGVKDLKAARPLAEPLAVVRRVTYSCPMDSIKNV